MSLQPQNPSDQEPLRWTCWQGLALAQPVKERVWEEILDGGQSFRWKKQEEIWTGIFGRYLAQLRTTKEGLEWRAPEGQKGVGLALASYLDAEGAQELARDALPWRSDGALGAAMARFGGLRILRQDPDEALLAFLCSSNKRILQIRGMVAALAKSMGEEIAPGYHALPGWERLARARSEELQACGLGYRAAFVSGTAKLLAERPDWHLRLEKLSTDEAEAKLGELPGVGPKVASCVALFGLGRLDAFPVDTWIERILVEAYGLEGWDRGRLAVFGRAHFGGAAGLAQQFLFAAARTRS
jgi:N-glycosylase/DNA lyase